MLPLRRSRLSQSDRHRLQSGRRAPPWTRLPPRLPLCACWPQACRTRTPAHAASCLHATHAASALHAFTLRSRCSFALPLRRSLPPRFSQSRLRVCGWRALASCSAAQGTSGLVHGILDAGTETAGRRGRSARLDAFYGVPRKFAKGCLFQRCDGSLRCTDRVRTPLPPVSAYASPLSLRTPCHTPSRLRGPNSPTAT